MTEKLEISWAGLWKILLFVVIVAVFYEGRQILLGLFLAIIISSGLEGVIRKMEKIGLPRSVSVILIFLIAVIILIFVVYSVVPILLVQLNNVLSDSGNIFGGTLGAIINFDKSQSIASAISKLSSAIFAGGSSPFDFLASALGSVGLVVAVILSSFYLSLSRDGVERFIKIVVPPDYERTALSLYDRSRRLISAWFRTQVLLTIVFGFTVWVGLALLHVKYALLIAVLAGIFELVPFVGPFLSGALAVIAALSTSTTLAIYTLIFFIVAEQLEANVFVPVLTQHIVGIHPVIVIVAILIGAQIGGILGIIISVPAAGVFQEVIQEWSTQKRTRAA